MKSILLTVTTEQLQKSVNDLQIRVNNLDTVKELQDKIVSYQDHQISFLNDSIANMWQPIAIVAGLIGLVFTGAFAYVAFLNRQAQVKVQLATEKMNEAEQKIEELNNQLQVAAGIVKESKIIAETAQDKLIELENEQKDLKKSASLLLENQQLDMVLSRSKNILDQLAPQLDEMQYELTNKHSTEDQGTLYIDLRQQHTDLKQKFHDLHLSFNSSAANGSVRDSDKEKIMQFDDDTLSFFLKAAELNWKVTNDNPSKSNT